MPVISGLSVNELSSLLMAAAIAGGLVSALLIGAFHGAVEAFGWLVRRLIRRRRRGRRSTASVQPASAALN